MKKLVFYVLILGTAPAFAEEKAETPLPVPKTLEESYDKVAGRVSGIEAKIIAKEAIIQSLLSEKKTVTDPARLKEVVKSLNSEHSELVGLAKELDQQKNLLKYRYPDKDRQGKREYKRTEVQSLEDMEKRNDLAISIDKTLARVRSKYPGFSEETEKKKQEKKLKDVAEPVILKK